MRPAECWLRIRKIARAGAAGLSSKTDQAPERELDRARQLGGPVVLGYLHYLPQMLMEGSGGKAGPWATMACLEHGLVCGIQSRHLPATLRDMRMQTGMRITAKASACAPAFVASLRLPSIYDPAIEGPAIEQA